MQKQVITIISTFPLVFYIAFCRQSNLAGDNPAFDINAAQTSPNSVVSLRGVCTTCIQSKGHVVLNSEHNILN